VTRSFARCDAVRCASAGRKLQPAGRSPAQLGTVLAVKLAAEDPNCQLPGGPQATRRRPHRAIFAYTQDVIIEGRDALKDDLIGTLLTMRVGDTSRRRPQYRVCAHERLSWMWKPTTFLLLSGGIAHS
jgi:hypothetical protein